MDVPTTNFAIIEQMRSWFHAKDRSVYLSDATLLFYLNNGAYLSDAFIAETVLSASAASITFSNIPQGFRHLQILTHARTDNAAESDNMSIRLNNDAGSSYDYQQVSGSSATAAAAAARAGTDNRGPTTEGANSRAACFAPGVIWIPQYSISGVEKYTISLSGRVGDLSADADLNIFFRVSHWRNLDVVSKIVLVPTAGANFVSGTRAQLYGVL